MVISHKHKFIFIHIPKCAGSSITSSLVNNLYFKLPRKDAWRFDGLSTDIAEVFKDGPLQGNSQSLNQHFNLKQINNYFLNNKWNINDYFKFSFMRNPWSRRVSQYQYAKRMSKEFNPKFDKNKNKDWAHKIAKMSFSEFLINKNELQLDWVKNKQGKISVDFLGPGKNLQEELNTVCDKIGIPQQQVPHLNETKHKHYTEYYDNETREIVTKKCANDIEYFGYKFGE